VKKEKKEKEEKKHFALWGFQKAASPLAAGGLVPFSAQLAVRHFSTSDQNSGQAATW